MARHCHFYSITQYRALVRLGVAAICSAILATAAYSAPVTSVGSGNWHDGGTWDSGVPGAADDVFVAASHTVTVTGLSVIAINSLSVSGVLEHANNTTTEAHKLVLDIAGDCTVASSGSMDVTGKGYRYDRHPSGAMVTAMYGMGGSHGGWGGKSRASEHRRPLPTYGSIVAPTNIGAGGRGYTGPFGTDGGGAIKLTVGGTTTLQGDLLADGIGDNLNLNGGGAGGSVWLTTSNLTGAGTIGARGAEGTYNSSSSGGGGGRIAVILTGSETFGGVTIEAHGGHGLNADGAAGTVYLQTSSETTETGHLIVDNNDHDKLEVIVEGSPDRWFRALTDLNGMASASYAFASVTITNGGMIHIGPDDSLNVTNGATLLGDAADGREGIRLGGGSLVTDASFTFTDLYIAIDSNGSSFNPGTALTIGTNADLVANVPHSLTGNVTVASGGCLTHDNNRTDELHKLDLAVTGNLTVDAGGSVDVVGKGYRYNLYPDGSYVTAFYGGGGSHGGRGGDGRPSENIPSYPTYGSLTAPTNIGAAGRGYTAPFDTDGGGAIKLTVSEILTVNGDIAADGIGTNLNLNGGGAGGSVYLIVSNLAGSGAIRADGAAGQYSGHTSGGGGGRIAVILTGSDSFGSVTMQAYGGDGLLQDGAAGTIYKQTQTQGAGNGELIVDNNNQSTPKATEVSTNVTDRDVGDVIMRNGGNFGVGEDATFIVDGNWSNGASFTAASGSLVQFGGTNVARIWGNQTFDRLHCTIAGKRLEFENGATNAVLTELILKGASGDELELRPITDGSYWFVNVDDFVTPDLHYLNVRYSDASPGLNLAPLNSTSNGFTINWSFTVAGLTNVWTGGSSSNWGDNANWSLGRPPIPAEGRVVISNGTFNPFLPSGKTYTNLDILAGADLNLAGYDLTVANDTTIAGTLTATGPETLTFHGDVTAPGTLTLAGSQSVLFYGDVDFTGGTLNEATTHIYICGTNGAQSIHSGGQSFYRLTVTNQSGVVTFADAGNVQSYRSESTDVTYSNDFTATDFRVHSHLGAVTQTFNAGSTYMLTEAFFFGSAGNTQHLESTSAAAWNLNASGSVHARHVDVAFSDASGGLEVVPISSADGGGNVNWDFTPTWKVWTGAAGSSFGTAASWEPTGVPDETHHILVDDPDTLTVDLAATVRHAFIGGESTTFLEVNDSFTVVEDVHVVSNGTLEINNDPGMTISNDLYVGANGLVTHNNNTTTEADIMCLTVVGNVTVLSNGLISVSGKGYRYGRHPSGAMVTAMYGMGGSHGGWGGKSRASEHRRPLPTYGSIVAPTNIGAGGRGYTSPRETDGGGAIKLTVGGTTTLHGDLLADGIGDNLNLNGGGAGGSVWLTTSNLAGAGTIGARGAEGTYNSSSSGGGGGRIAVILTGSETFGGVTIEAHGGHGLNHDGAAGTVYLQTSSETAETGHLIVDNNDHDKLEVIVEGAPDRWFRALTDLNGMASANYAFARVTITNGGMIHIGPDDSLSVTNGAALFGDAADGREGIRLGGGSLVTDASFAFTNLYIAIETNGSLFSPGTALTIGTNADLVANVPHSITGNVTVASGGCLTHDNNRTDELHKLDLTVTGNLTVNAGASVDVVGRGYRYNLYPDGGYITQFYGGGGSHGGRGGDGRLPENITSYPAYGSLASPTNIGAAGRGYTAPFDTDGGGAVKLTVTGSLTLDGEILADGIGTNLSLNGGGAGGSVWLTVSTMAGSGTIRARGADSTYSTSSSGGSGGRIAVVLTGGDSFGSVSMLAPGGDGLRQDGMAGTVYKQRMSDGDGGGVIVIDNDGLNPTIIGRTASIAGSSPPFSNELERATLVITNTGTEFELTDTVYIDDLLVYTNAYLVLNTYTMYVNALEHSLEDANDFGPGFTNRVDNYGQIVWIGASSGTIILFR